MAGFGISLPFLLTGGLFLMGFFVFIILYILIRLLAERHEHSKHEIIVNFNKEDEQKKIKR